MEYRHPDSAEAVIPPENRQHDKCAGELNDKSPFQNKTRQTHNAADRRSGKRILHGASFLEGNVPPGKHQKGCRHCDDAETSDLDQQKDQTLPERRPVAAAVTDDKTGHADRRCRSKKRVGERRGCPCGRCRRKHQQQRTCNDHSGKAEYDDLKGCKTPKSPKKIFHQTKSPPCDGFRSRQALTKPVSALLHRHGFSWRSNPFVRRACARCCGGSAR